MFLDLSSFRMQPFLLLSTFHPLVFFNPHSKVQLSGGRKPATVSCSGVSSPMKTSEEESPVSPWCPSPSMCVLDSKGHHCLPFACGPIWAVRVGSTFHTLPSPQGKWKHTRLNPSATSGFQEVRLPPKMISLMAPKCFPRHYGR